MTDLFMSEVRARTLRNLCRMATAVSSRQCPPCPVRLDSDPVCLWAMPISSHSIVISTGCSCCNNAIPFTPMHMQSFFLEAEDTADGPAVNFRAGADAILDDLVSALATSSANELDGRVSDALRNNLFGLAEGQDLVGRNIFRSRDVALPTYAGLAECFGITPDVTVRPSPTPLTSTSNCSCVCVCVCALQAQAWPKQSSRAIHCYLGQPRCWWP